MAAMLRHLEGPNFVSWFLEENSHENRTKDLWNKALLCTQSPPELYGGGGHSAEEVFALPANRSGFESRRRLVIVFKKDNEIEK